MSKQSKKYFNAVLIFVRRVMVTRSDYFADDLFPMKIVQKKKIIFLFSTFDFLNSRTRIRRAVPVPTGAIKTH